MNLALNERLNRRPHMESGSRNDWTSFHPGRRFDAEQAEGGGGHVFNARIVGDFILDDGERDRREFGVEADLGERKVDLVLSVAEFARMDWVLNRLGPRAIVYPGQKQHARAAIQWLS